MITKLTEPFDITDKSQKIQYGKIIANPLHTFKRAFRGLEKEVF